MLGVCREYARFLSLSYQLGSIQLVSSHAAHLLAALSPARTVASGSVATKPCSQIHEQDRQQTDDLAHELSYFDEPLELQLNHTSARPVRQPATAVDSVSSHPINASSKPHSLENLVDSGELVQQLVDRSLGQLSAGHRVKRNLKSIIYRAAAAAASKQGIPSAGLAALASAQVNSDQEQSNSETSQLQEACSSKSVSSTANVTQPATSTQKQQLLRQVMLQDLDSNAFNEVTQQLKGDQQRQNAESKAFAVLRDLWQQAEPPASVKGHELELINSYDAMLRYCVHFKSIMQQQQQQAAAALEQSSGQPGSNSRPRRRSTASSSSSSTIMPSSSSAATATPPVQPATATTAESGAAGGLPHQTVTSWRRTREAVLNELRVRDLAAMIETAGWEIPIGKLDKSTNRRKSRTKAGYIQIILQQELRVVEALLAHHEQDGSSSSKKET